MYLTDQTATVLVPTFFVERNQWQPYLQFGVVIPRDRGVVRFEPVIGYEGKDVDIFVNEIAIARGIFNCSAEEIGRIEEIYREFSGAIHTYFSLCYYSTAGPTPHSYLETALTFPLTTKERTQIQAELDQFTFIYVIKDRTTGYVKIGKSNDPEHRLKQLKRQDTLMPTPNDFHLLFFAKYYGYLEKVFHKQFAEKQVRGEWFNLSDADIDEIKTTLNRDSNNGVIDCF